ncbi:MAG: glycerol-3-phosphate dehydrogenase/oxidase [Proteobacteria bacterium]|nr:glycerol-3-phosphate dehydrogenase/oxidase [Pseudomonadota bacterium]
MIRSEMIARLEKDTKIWDVIVIGGGATGLGAAVESASRGYSTLLLEQGDFAQGTSSRSTKLIHGGIRYLQQGNISLVLEALHERGLLLQNAPHLVRHQSFVVPNYSWWEGPFYGVGLKVYDVLAGKLGLKKSTVLSREMVLEKIPTLEPSDLKGGVIYYDGQFDDARLAVTLAQTAEDLGACVLNYSQVVSLIKSNDLISGVCVADKLTGTEYEVMGKAVINATGIFVDSILKMDMDAHENIISPSQGVHIVLDKSFLPGDTAIMVPHTDDGRVLFAVPWHDRVIVGTTDTAIEKPSLEPLPFKEELDFLLGHAAKYLTKDPVASDVLSAFAGIRPLINAGNGKKTATLSRDHHLNVSPSGLITIAGGKWTTYRKMGEDTIDAAIPIGALDLRKSRTRNLSLNGWSVDDEGNAPYGLYGNNSRLIKRIVEDDPTLGKQIHERLPYRFAEVVWAVRNEMAFFLDDVLSRRTRSLILDARASMEAAPEVARVMAKELGKDEAWQKDQVERYMKRASTYLVP